VFTRPDGQRISECGPQKRAGDAARFRGIVHADRFRGIHIDASTSRCKWLGERMDYSSAIESMQFREAAAATAATAVAAPS
jgi:hypothetical protein